MLISFRPFLYIVGLFLLVIGKPSFVIFREKVKADDLLLLYEKKYQVLYKNANCGGIVGCASAESVKGAKKITLPHIIFHTPKGNKIIYVLGYDNIYQYNDTYFNFRLQLIF